jgi:hypothetical protein
MVCWLAGGWAGCPAAWLLGSISEGGEGVAPALRPRFYNTSGQEENFHIATHPMNDMHTQCPQCLLANSIDCQEPDCPCLSGVPPKKEGGAACMDGASMKLLTTMGLRILALEDLIVRAAGMVSDDTAHLDVLREARRILGKKRGAAV